MTLFTFSIQIEPDRLFPQDTDILFNADVLKAMGLTRQKEITVSLGSRITTARLGISSASKSILLIAQSLANKLLLPFNCNLNVSYIPADNKIELGPVLGILISYPKMNSAQPFGRLTSFCEEISIAAKHINCLYYIVTLDLIDFDDNCVRGWYRVDKKWEQFTFPLPDAFYNRLSSRMYENKAGVIKKLELMHHADIPVFNDRFLNKWEVHQILAKEDTNSLLPHTILYRNLRDLQHMLSLYSVVFIKPIHGSLGRGIIRIRKSEQGYIFEQTTVNGLNRKLYDSSSSLFKKLLTKLRRREYLIQQGIPFVQSGESSIDFRVLLQKNREGRWQVTSNVARLGSPNTFVSNLAQGGNIIRIGEIYKKLSLSPAVLPSITSLKKRAIFIANKLEEKLDGHYGELGIDLGIDKYGKIWLIEVNSKPSKNEETILSLSSKPRPSVLHLFDYVFYLTRFPSSTIPLIDRKKS